MNRMSKLLLVSAAAFVLAGSAPIMLLAQERGHERDGRGEIRRDEERREAPRPKARGMDARHDDRFAHWAPRGDIRHFRDGGDYDAWRRGHWIHDHHAGRFGWWWVVGNDWYLYPTPVYPYPDPYIPPTVSAQPPPPMQAAPPAWFYCRSQGGYYPYVTSCPEGWMQTAPQG